jgi:hypothetical protein
MASDTRGKKGNNTSWGADISYPNDFLYFGLGHYEVARYDAPAQVEMRTVAPDNPHIWDEPRFRDAETRPVLHWGIAGAQRAGPLAAPGGYRVRMSAGGQTWEQPFEVLKDPEVAASEADLKASTEAQVRITEGLDQTAEMVNKLEIMRKQIEDQIGAQKGSASVVRALRDLDGRMMDVELMLLTRSDMQSDDKWFVEAYKVYLNLIWLNGQIGTGAGDVAGGADFRPTDAQMQILQMLEQQLAEAKTAYDRLMTQEVPAFNRTMAGKVPEITTTPTPRRRTS